MKLPKTHIKQIETVKVIASNSKVVNEKFIGQEIEFKLYEAGVSYHNNQYTPTTVYFTSIDGVTGAKFTGENALENAKSDIAKSVSLIGG